MQNVTSVILQYLGGYEILGTKSVENCNFADISTSLFSFPLIPKFLNQYYLEVAKTQLPLKTVLWVAYRLKVYKGKPGKTATIRIFKIFLYYSNNPVVFVEFSFLFNMSFIVHATRRKPIQRYNVL
jgi:hypothetical protein